MVEESVQWCCELFGVETICVKGEVVRALPLEVYYADDGGKSWNDGAAYVCST